MSSEKISNYLHFIEKPLKLVASWQWYPKPVNVFQTIANNFYLFFVLFTLMRFAVGIALHLHTEWVDIMSCLDQLADSLPILVSAAIVSYFAIYRDDLYELKRFMTDNFKHRSALGLTNMTMMESYRTAAKFARIYTACTMFSVTMYATLPVLVHFWTREPIQGWLYEDVSWTPLYFMLFLQSLVTQWFVGLAMGQFGIFFAANSIIICGQLDLLCCSLRNIRYTALLQNGVHHAAIASVHHDIQRDELHGYTYSQAEMAVSGYHYDQRMEINFTDPNEQFDIYSTIYDEATMSAVRDCSMLCQAVMEYKDKFERFVSPLLALRVIQVTLYLCTLLYTATLKFNMMTVEYLAAVALDIFVYCYFGNQIILQADRVSLAAYQSAWHATGVRPRKALLNLLLANSRPVVIRAGRFLPMDLHTFVVIIKTSFSYYTLLVNVNEQ